MEKKEHKLKGSLAERVRKLPGHEWSNLHFCLQSFFMMVEAMQDGEPGVHLEQIGDAINVVASEMECSAVNAAFDLITGKARHGEYRGVVEMRCGKETADAYTAAFSSKTEVDLADIYMACRMLYHDQEQL